MVTAAASASTAHHLQPAKLVSPSVGGSPSRLSGVTAWRSERGGAVSVDPRGVYDLVAHREVPCCADFPHTITIATFDPHTGRITGTGTNPQFSLTGSLVGSQIIMNIVYPGSSYTGTITGTVGPGLHMSGTFTDSLGQSGTWTATRLKCPEPKTGNLVCNGDFSSGNGAFTSGYAYSPSSLGPPATYSVGANPTSLNGAWPAMGDHTTGSGPMMIVNGSTNPNVTVWSETVSVVRGTQYRFTIWVASLYPDPASLQFDVNGVPLAVFAAPVRIATWAKDSASWQSGSNTTAILSIVDKNTDYGGNDFALDDISWTRIQSGGAVVQNGSLEDLNGAWTNTRCGYMALPAASTAIADWTVSPTTDGQVAWTKGLTCDGYTAADGLSFVDLTGLGAASLHGALQQQLTTVAGQQYTFSIDEYAHNGCSLSVTVGAQSVTLRSAGPSFVVGHTTWTPHLGSFKGDPQDTTPTLTIMNARPGADICFIDDIRVQVGGGGGGDPGEPTPEPGCRYSSFRFGPVVAEASCFVRRGGKYVADGRVRVGGVDFIPVSGKITVEPSAFEISGDVEVRVSSISLYKGQLDWRFSGNKYDFSINLPSSIKGFRIGGTARCKDGSYSDSQHRPGTCSHHGGVEEWLDRSAVDGHIELSERGASLRLLAALPAVFGGVTGEVTLAADDHSGLHLDSLKITAAEAQLGAVHVSHLLFSYQATAGGDRWEGSAMVNLPLKLPPIDGDVVIEGGGLSYVSGGVSNLNRLIAQAVFLQSVHFSITFKPNFGLSGAMSLSAGPSLNGQTAARMDGKMTFTSGNPAIFRIEGDLTLVSKEVASAYLEFRTSGQLDFGGKLDFTQGGFGLKASVDGFIEPDAFNAAGHGELDIAGQSALSGDGVVSSKGIAACAQFSVAFATWRVGAGYYWPARNQLNVMAAACDVGPWRVAKSLATLRGLEAVTAPLASPPTMFALPRGLPGTVFGVFSSSAAPQVEITSPSGEQFTTPATPNAIVRGPRVLILRNDVAHVTYVAVAAPAAGIWRVIPLPGSEPVTEVREADGLTEPVVRARVAGQRHQRRLDWTLRPLPGQRVRFYEQSGALGRTIAVTARARGSARFTPTDGPGGPRKIMALVEQDGLPRATISVASYTAPPPFLPERPRRVQARRVGNSLHIAWTGGQRTKTYLVKVLLSDGRGLIYFRRANKHSLIVARVSRHTSGTVAITAISASGRRTRAVRVRISA
jgi:hypothetical protein